MKKSLLFLATAALFASCSDDMLEPGNGFQASKGKGVTFEIVKDGATRGITEEKFNVENKRYFDSYFFAEKDRINIWSSNALNSSSFGTSWEDAAVMYKATKSQGNPNFTAVSDENMLNLKDYWYNSKGQLVLEKGSFFVAYPTGQSAKANYDKNGNLTKFTITPTTDPAKSLQTQVMDGYMNFDGRYMYDYAQAWKAPQIGHVANVKDDNKSVGESVQLTLNTPLAMAVFVLEDYISGNYKNDFGGLNEVAFANTENKPVVPAVEGQKIIAEAEDLYTIGGVTYLINTLNPIYPKISESDRYVEIPKNSGNFYEKSTCKVVEGVYVLGENSVIVENPSAPDKSASPKGYELMEGSKKAKVGDEIDAIHHTDFFEFNVANKAQSYINKATETDPTVVRKAKLTIKNIDIKDGDAMNLFVLPTSGHNDDKEAKYTITYKFKNVDLTYTKSTAKDFTAGEFLRFPLKIADQFSYIVTRGNEGDARSLIVNSNTLTKVFNEGNDKTYVVWTDQFATDGKVDPSKITSITIRKGVEKLTSAEWGLLNKFTNVKTLKIENATEELEDVTKLTKLEELTANNVTKVKQNAFNSDVVKSLKKLYLNKVTTFETQDKAFEALTDVNLNSYPFKDNTQVSPEKFFNDDTKKTLVNVDLSSVDHLAPEFGYERNILFTDYTKLETIKLCNAGTKISAKEFMGCTQLSTVSGVIDLGTAASAFENCKALSTVNVAGTTIPARAFAYSGVVNVKKDGKQVAPTKINESAFEGNEAIVEMNLTQAETIEKSAFKGAKKFIGNTNASSSNVVTLIVPTVKAYAFDGTAVVRFQLINATSTENHSLNSQALKQIKYRKVLSGTAPIHTDQVVEKKATVGIFVANEDNQKYFSGYETVTEETFDWPWQ